MKCMKWMNWNESIDMNELKWRNWNAWIETNELSWMNWNERIEMNEIDVNELKRMNRHEWIETNKWKRMNWDDMNWHEWIETNELTWSELTWMNWNEWLEMKELKRMNELMNEMNEFKWMNWHEWIETNELKRMNWKKWLCQPHLEKVGRNPSVFYDFYVKSSSHYIHVHILSTSSSKSGKKSSVFDDFYVINYLMTIWSTDETALSLQSRAHFVDLIFKKWSDTVSFLFFYVKPSSRYSLVRILSTSSLKRNEQFFTIFMWHRALATLSCTFCRPYLQKRKKAFSLLRFLYDIELSLQSRAHFVDHFPGSRRATAETETLQRRPQTATSPKKHRVLRPRVFSAVNSRIPDRSHFPMMMWLIDMMMWLTWWLRWWLHGDVVAMMVRQLAIDNEIDNRP